MTDWIFRSLIGSRIRPQRRGMEQSYFQSLDGMRLFFHRECWHFFFFFEWKFLRVILEDSSIHSVEHLEILQFISFILSVHLLLCAVDHLLPENSGKLVFRVLGYLIYISPGAFRAQSHHGSVINTRRTSKPCVQQNLSKANPHGRCIMNAEISI